jgi:glycosyltransferase involved in cell wall biosynthesis
MARLAILGSRGIPAKYGAFEVASEKIAGGFLEKGWAVTVFCPHNQSYREPFYQGIALRRVWHPPGGMGSLLYDGLSLLIASAGHFDAILMFGYGAGPFFFIPRLFGTPLVVNTDGLEWKRSKWSLAVKLYFRVCERVVTLAADRLISDAWGIKRYYKEKYGVDSEYIAYGTELPDSASDDVSDFGLEPKRYYLVVMRLEPENSILEIVRGYLASHSVRPLILVGPSTPFFDHTVRPLLDGHNRARYLGPIYQRERVFTLRRNAFAYVHGHTVGGTNPSLLEAMASANFVVAKDVEFNREVVGELGRYFATEEQLTRILDELEQADPDAIDRLGRAGRAVIEQKFQWGHVIEAYARVIGAAISARRSGGG